MDFHGIIQVTRTTISLSEKPLTEDGKGDTDIRRHIG